MVSSFYFKYINKIKKNRLRKQLTTVVCAGAVAFTAMCTGYLDGFSDDMDSYMESISELELIIVNKTNPISGLYSERGDVFTDEEIEKICGLDNIKIAVPFLTFSRRNSSHSAEVDLSNDESARENYDSSVLSFQNDAGEVSIPRPDVVYDGPYSYSDESVMDSRCISIDSTSENGAYLSASLASSCGLSEDDLNHLRVSLDMWVPIGILNTYHMGTASSSESEIEEISFRGNKYVTKKVTINVPVRGILASDPLDTSSSIFLSAELMLQEQRRADDGLITANKILDLEKEYNAENPDSIWAENPSTLINWGPCIYYVVAKDIASIGNLKESIAAINPNFEIIQKYQDLQAGTQIISNTRNVMVYISLAVLAVVFLLTALVYVSLIDKRKYEFVVLRANGLTKREVRRVLYAEMALQFALIFVVGLLFAGLIYFIGGRWLGYPFQFDGLTVLWLFLISLGAVVLPTVISLLFVNRFEPDQVMRN